MRHKQIRGLAASTARTWLVLLGSLGLAFGTVVSIGAQESAARTDAMAPQTITANLDYREVDYPVNNLGLQVTAKSTAFKKEPVLSGNKVIRGTLQLGLGTGDGMAFAWDRAAGKLFLDLNRNLDLTDDTAGTFSCGRTFNDNFQSFANVHLPFKTPAGSQPMLADLSFYYYGQANCTVAMRSFWQGKVTLQGADWQVGLLANPLSQPASLESGNLLLRPWGDRNNPFSVFSGTLEAVPFSRNLFVGNQAYQLRCTNDLQGGAVRAQIQFTQQQPKLGELKITGDFVQRLTLEGGPYLVLLDKPAGVAKVPVGRYASTKVSLKRGGAQAYLDERTRTLAGKITVSEAAPAVLTVGGPLTNSVTVHRQGRKLALNYQLVGAGGAYQLANQD